MPILAFLALAVQLFFIIHVVKTRREYYWILILIFFSIFGCIVYFFVEFLPDMRRGNRL